jgi:signal transduction histidine kinase
MRAGPVSEEVMSMSENRDAVLGTEIRSATHELRNVLAIVKDLAGLIEDVVHAAEPGEELNTEKVLRASGRIRAQVDRGVDIASDLREIALRIGSTRASATDT